MVNKAVRQRSNVFSPEILTSELDAERKVKSLAKVQLDSPCTVISYDTKRSRYSVYCRSKYAVIVDSFLKGVIQGETECVVGQRFRMNRVWSDHSLILTAENSSVAVNKGLTNGLV